MYNSDMEKIMRKKNIKRKLTRARAIKLYCKEMCCAGDLKGWKECNYYSCFLWKFRLGREIHGNQTSFKKTRGNRPILKQNNDSVGKVEVENDARD